MSLKCPICSREASTADTPFCSARCADIDLSRWLNGAYAIPVRPDDQSETEIELPMSDMPSEE